ncbi:MAG: hypothetical protein EZS28_012585 [Streblomastix strix]|uniref:SPRY domain-containing protein n=1 Tax=Streblomastix strix TaxID=222440 RepID=A0A5J4WAB5_9EUKA|nr:MAG: hypothetical protein EZS28_012585 [Streblomastix strix]
MLNSCGKLFHIVNTWHPQSAVENQPFQCRQRLSVEVDMNQRRAYFFVDGKEQKNFIINLPNAVRFYAFISQPGSSFQITRFESLAAPSVSGVPGSMGWEQGKKWQN